MTSTSDDRRAREKRSPHRPGPAPVDPQGGGRADSIELVRLGREGDPRALNDFLGRYRPRLLRVVRIRMGTFLRRYHDPEDIVQESLVVAVSKLAEFRAQRGSNLICWLTQIADHVANNQRVRLQAQKRDPRRERRIRLVDPPSSTDGGLVLRDAHPSPSEVTSQRELENRVDGCVERLEPESYRQVILLRDYMEADWETIRGELGRPSVESARELHRRARAKLRERLAQLDF